MPAKAGTQARKREIPLIRLGSRLRGNDNLEVKTGLGGMTMSRLNRLSKRKLNRLLATKRDSPSSDDDAVERLYGFMEGSVLIPDGVDLTAPVLEDQAPGHVGVIEC